MRKAQKASLTAGVIVAGVLVFLPKTYKWLSEKIGNIVDIGKVGE